MKTVDKEKALKALKYAGLMGHEFVGLEADYRIGAEGNTAKWVKEQTPNGSVWQQLPKRKWKQVA